MTLAALAAMLWSLPAAAQEEYRQPALGNPESWSVVVIPDLQGYAKNEASQPIARLMTAWIADNIERLNVRMVLCVGDVVEQNDRIGNGFSGDLTSVRQWQGMADAFDVLDGRVPYLVATGNHDYTYTRSGARRTHLNEYFPIGRNPLNAAAICQFGLDSDENPAVENCAFELKAPDGKDYLFLNMEFAPRDTVMKWAQQVAGLEEYAGHRIVLITHAYLDAKDQRAVRSLQGDELRTAGAQRQDREDQGTAASRRQQRRGALAETGPPGFQHRTGGLRPHFGKRVPHRQKQRRKGRTPDALRRAVDGRRLRGQRRRRLDTHSGVHARRRDGEGDDFLAPVRHFAHYAAVRLDARREERIYVPLQQIRPGYGIVPNLK